MKEINSVQMGTSSGAIARLPRPVDFPNGRGCARMRVEAVIPFKNNTAGAENLTGAHVKAAMACLFETSTLKFGERAQDNVDVALSYTRLRELCIALSGDDFVIVTGTGPKRLRDVADADVISAAVGAGATVNLTVEIARPFEVVRLGEDAFSYCPGATQMRQIQWEFVRGSTFDPGAKFVQGAAADLLFLADDFEASDDKWAAVPRIYQQEEAGRTSHGPKGSIGLLGLWEYTSAGSATALTLFSIERQADAKIHDNVRASRVVRDALYTDPVGFYDLNALVTVLHSLPAGSEKNDVPTGEGFAFQQTGSELNPPKTAWLYVPARTEAEIDDLVGPNVQNERGVKLVSAAVKGAKGVTSNVASLEPVIIVHREGADFEASPGRIYSIGMQPTTHLPDRIAAAASAASSSPDPDAAEAGASKAAGQIAKALPGYSSARRGMASIGRRTLAARFRGRKVA